ncbi:unnamed protein product, partial [Effrenium voratum]
MSADRVVDSISELAWFLCQEVLRAWTVQQRHPALEDVSCFRATCWWAESSAHAKERGHTYFESGAVDEVSPCRLECRECGSIRTHRAELWNPTEAKGHTDFGKMNPVAARRWHQNAKGFDGDTAEGRDEDRDEIGTSSTVKWSFSRSGRQTTMEPQ